MAISNKSIRKSWYYQCWTHKTFLWVSK